MKQTRCTARAHAFAIAIDGCRAHPGGIASRSRDRRAQAAKTALLEMVALPIKYARLHARARVDGTVRNVHRATRQREGMGEHTKKRFARRRSREAVEEVGPTGAPRNVGTKTFAFFIRERTAVR